MLVIGVVALLVIGPEKLPRVARTVGALLGRAQRYVNDVKADINREIELDEFKKIKTSVTEAAQSFESSVKESVASFEAQASDLGSSVSQSGSGSAAPAPSAEALDKATDSIHQALADAAPGAAEHATQGSLQLDTTAAATPASTKAG